MQNKTYNLILVALFAALMTVGAFFKITLPPPFPAFTFQIFFAILAGLLLGSKLGFLSQVIYIALGLVGVPVFANGGGIHYVLHYTFGYLLGFAVAAFIVGLLRETMTKSKPKFIHFLIASVVGLLVCYLVGVPYMYIIMNFYMGKAMTVKAAVMSGFVTFLPLDLIKMIIASWLAREVYTRVNLAKSKSV